MVESPSVSLSRAVLPSSRKSYSFDTDDLPEGFFGGGEISTRSTHLNDERASSAIIFLYKDLGDKFIDIESKLRLKPPFEAGHDVEEKFDLYVTQVIEESEIDLGMINQCRNYGFDYFSEDDRIPKDRGKTHAALDGETLEAPFDVDFRSREVFGKAWPEEIMGDPKAQGSIEAWDPGEKTIVKYNIEGLGQHYETNLDKTVKEVLSDMGLCYDEVSPEYSNSRS